MAETPGFRRGERNQSRPPRRQPAVHDQVYEAIRQAPDHRPHRAGRRGVLRSLAAELGVSPMPVRDAVRRLVAERALAINPANKRLSVPSLTAARLEQLSQARLWIEPELAARAAPHADAALIKRLRDLDARRRRRPAAGRRRRLHDRQPRLPLRPLRAPGAEVLLSMAGGLWLQIGPFMRVVFGRVGADGLPADRHAEAMDRAEGPRRRRRAARHRR
jgi:DNA-binding GntR family transcriptional regulator